MLANFSAHWIPRVEAEMRDVINAPANDDATLAPLLGVMLGYHLGFANADGTAFVEATASGKRVRPMLTLLACEACGGDPRTALPAAAAVELLHNFSLIHDDIEDGDEVRRGRPTVWKVWGMAQAINAGDAMFAMAHLALQRARDFGATAERTLRALRTFDAMCVHLTAGQHLDLGFELRADVSADDYVRMIDGKTAALTRASCAIGAILGGGSDARIEALGEFGRQLGLAFQLQDDVLGIWGDPNLTGKADDDLKHRKKTLPVLYAADRIPAVRELYFRPAHDPTTRAELTDAEAAQLRGMIEACGGRDYAERAAEGSFEAAMSALARADVAGEAAELLGELARGLRGRQA